MAKKSSNNGPESNGKGRSVSAPILPIILPDSTSTMSMLLQAQTSNWRSLSAPIVPTMLSDSTPTMSMLPRAQMSNWRSMSAPITSTMSSDSTSTMSMLPRAQRSNWRSVPALIAPTMLSDSTPTTSMLQQSQTSKRSSLPSSGQYPVPRAAANQRHQIDEPVPVRPKLLKRFYESLVMLGVLGQNRGAQVDEEGIEDDPQLLGTTSLRRSFLRSLAYLCDFEKGGNTTTAIALQKTNQKIVYWMASNESNDRTDDQARKFLSGILLKLKNQEISNGSLAEMKLFEDAVKFSKKRIKVYTVRLNKSLQLILETLSNSKSQEEISIVAWFRKLEMSLETFETACKFCYDERRSDEYQILHKRSQGGYGYTETYQKIRHDFGRLNHTMKAVKVVVTARQRFPHLFDEYDVDRTPSQGEMSPPLSERNPTLSAIAGRMRPDPKSIAEYRKALNFMDQKFQLSKRLEKQCLSRTWKPRVHAEILLLNLFWTDRYEFVDGDRYIGCSKPACYSCHKYIMYHPGGFVVPACHNNNWINWRAPDITRQDLIKEQERELIGEPTRDPIKERETILNDMTEQIRREVCMQIMQRRGPAGFKPDSVTEISSLLSALQVGQHNLGPKSMKNMQFEVPSGGSESDSKESNRCNSEGKSDDDSEDDSDDLSNDNGIIDNGVIDDGVFDDGADDGAVGNYGSDDVAIDDIAKDHDANDDGPNDSSDNDSEPDGVLLDSFLKSRPHLMA